MMFLLQPFSSYKAAFVLLLFIIEPQQYSELDRRCYEQLRILVIKKN